MVSILSKDLPHCHNTLACCSIAGDPAEKTKGTHQSLILDESPRLQQVHRSLSLRLNREPFGFKKPLPFRKRQRPGAVVDNLCECVLNLTFGALVEIVGNQATAPWPQRLCHVRLPCSWQVVALGLGGPYHQGQEQIR